MTILALEFSSSRRSVALARDGRLLAEAVEHSGARGTNALGLIEQALATAGLTREAVEVIVVGLGPGSYTGIRAAIAVAQGWELARGAKLLGLGSLESLAAVAREAGIRGRVHLAVDAQRGEFYLAEWDISGAGVKAVSPLVIVPAGELAARQSRGEICLGPELAKAVFPSAATTAVLAAGRADFLPGEKLEPIYLRETSFVKAPAGRMV